MADWYLIIGTLALVFTASRLQLFYRNLKDSGQLSVIKCAFSPFLLPGVLLPTTSWNPGQMLTWVRKGDLYSECAQDAIAVVPFFVGKTILYTCSPEVAKQVLGHKSGWDKLDFQLRVLAPFGTNVVASTQYQWPKHRKIMTPGFGPKLYNKVWTETVGVYKDMIFSEGWATKAEIQVNDMITITSKMAMHVVAASGFGLPFSWQTSVGSSEADMSAKECLEVCGRTMIHRFIFPKWAFRLPITPLARIGKAYDTLDLIFRDMIDKRRSAGHSQEEILDKDVFSLLLDANEEEEDMRDTLSDEELISNMMILMLAGHETTGRAIGAALGLLACHPQKQQKAFQEAASVLPAEADAVPTVDLFESLPYILACIYEAMRLYPPAHLVNRRPTTDTVLSVPDRGISIPVKKDTHIVIDIIGICYNPRLYPDPGQFLPSRWISSDIDLPMNFSYGPRICLGRRFALTEAVCIVAMLLRDWTVHPVQDTGETLDQWRKRAMDESATHVIGFGPATLPLRLSRRRDH